MQQSNPAWIGLLISGIINLLWALVYLVWTGLGLLWGGFAAIIHGVAALESGEMMNAVMGLLAVLTPIVQGCVYLLAIPLALLTIVAAFRLKAWRSKGLVWLGALVAVGNPVLGLLSSVTSCCNASCSGLFLGNAGTLVVTAIGAIAAVWVAVVLSSEEGKTAFQANA